MSIQPRDRNGIRLNTEAYWNARFLSGDWAARGGYTQTEKFAIAQAELYNIDRSFNGTICDFGCGAGDAFPIYRSNFPQARLIGVDFSDGAITLCRQRHGSLGTFIRGNATDIPNSDVIICSNVLEHIPDYSSVVDQLRQRCRRLLVIVPYREKHLIDEHINTYTRNAFSEWRPSRKIVFASPGWSEFGKSLWVDVHLKNIARLIVNRPTRRRRMQILCEIGGEL